VASVAWVSEHGGAARSVGEEQLSEKNGQNLRDVLYG